MRPQHPRELWRGINHRIHVFNHQTGGCIPDMYTIPPQPTPKALIRMRLDLDSLAQTYGLDSSDEDIRDAYLTIRERIEAMHDIMKSEYEFSRQGT